jgi:hypothetical protein
MGEISDGIVVVVVVVVLFLFVLAILWFLLPFALHNALKILLLRVVN